jgi:hypothetical protein
MAIGFPVKDDYVTGDVLTAANMNDLSGTVNTLQSTEYAAGKNKIINGDFNINQRAFTSTTSSVYGFDRWQNSVVAAAGSVTFSAQTFTLGSAPVAGYEGSNFLRIVSTGQAASSDNGFVAQLIEDVRTFAGQTVTVSFWAKANSGTPSISVEAVQSFGTGGSPSSNVTGSVAAGTTKKISITTSWVRYSATLTIPSISGKTMGTNANTSFIRMNFWISGGSNFDTRTDSLGIQNNTFEIWGIQAEKGSVATAFQTATGTIQGELAACQRYYIRYTAGPYTTAGYYNTTQLYPTITFPVEMRIAPTAIGTSAAGALVSYVNGSSRTSTALTFNASTTKTLNITMTTSSATAGQAGGVDVVSTQFVEMSAEL